jgi:hypothetical protein
LRRNLGRFVREVVSGLGNTSSSNRKTPTPIRTVGSLGLAFRS